MMRISAKPGPRLGYWFVTPRPACTRQAGLVLIVSLLILVMLTLLTITMFHSYTLQHKIAGNTMEKERGFQVAESALQFGEHWLTGPEYPGTGEDCKTLGPVKINPDAAITNIRVCDQPLASPSDAASWANNVMNYQPATLTMALGGGTANDANGDINYSQLPGLHIAYLGFGPNGQELLYQLTGVGYGGSLGTNVVVQSVFAVRSTVQALDNP